MAAVAIKNIRYPGNKHVQGAYHTIINHLPPCDVLISGFCGTCAVLTHIRPASKMMGIDLNMPKLLPYWKQPNMPPVALVQDSFFNFIKQFTFSKTTKQQYLLYLDPPYKLDTRRSERSLYKYEFTDEQHHELISLVNTLTNLSNIHIAISHYPCPLYDSLLKCGWRKIEYQTTTARGPVIEALYMNYPPPAALHDYKFLGRDFTDRQRIKRRKNAFIAKFKQMPQLERMAILQELQKLYNG